MKKYTLQNLIDWVDVLPEHSRTKKFYLEVFDGYRVDPRLFAQRVKSFKGGSQKQPSKFRYSVLNTVNHHDGIDIDKQGKVHLV